MAMNEQLSRAGSGLLSALDAIRNVRALLLMLGSLVIAALLFGAGTYFSTSVSPFFGILFVLAGLVVAFYGSNGVGIMLMDQARGEPPRPVLGAVMQSLATGHRLIVVGLIVGALYLAGLIVLMLIMFICKIPFLGPLLFTVVFPVSVVICGVAAFALFAVIFPLAAPAVWSGATSMQAVSRLAAIARKRLVNVLVMMLLLFLLTGIAAGLVGMVMAGGTAITAGVAAPILGGGMGFMLSGMNGFMGAGGSYVIAATIGAGVVYAMAFSLPSLIYVRGCCQVYLASIEGIDTAAVESELQSRMNSVRERAEVLRERHMQPKAPSESAAAPRAAAATPSFETPAATILRCAKCGEPHLPGDKFCGSCGAAL